MNIFYKHLIDVNLIKYELDQMGLSSEEKKHLTSFADTSMHYTILDLILSELSESDKRMFITKLSCEDSAKIWEFLNQKVERVEEKIKQSAERLQKELHNDIKKVNLKRKK